MERINDQLRQEGYEPLTWNACRRDNGDNTFTAALTTCWLSYMDPVSKEWQHIDLNFKQVADGFVIDKAPYGFKAPLKADGNIMFEDNTVFDEGDKKIKEESPIRKFKKFLGAKPVDGVVTDDGVLYEAAFPTLNADLLLQQHEQFVRSLVVFRSEPSGVADVEIPFEQNVEGTYAAFKGDGEDPEDFDEEIGSQEKDSGCGVLIKKSDFRYIRISKARAWDSAGKMIEIVLRAKRNNGKLTMTKVIPRTFLSQAAYPVFTDTTDNFTSSTSDRGIVSNDPTFSTYRGGNNLTLESESSTTLYAVNWYSGGADYYGYRSYVWWDTSALSDLALISAVDIILYYPATHASLTRTTYCVENRQASTTLATSDWTLIGASGVGTGSNQPYASISRTSGEAAGTKTFSLNATGITKVNVSGNTYYAFISAYDWDNSAPPNESTTGAEFNSANAASNKPILSVTYTVEVTPTAPSSLAAAPVSGSPGSMALTWVDNSATETAFSIERSLDGATGWTEVLTPAANATSATDTGLTGDTVYYYRMRAYRSSDTSYSSYTSTANATTAPKTPTGAAAVGLDGTTNIRVSWTDASSTETSYNVERSDDGMAGWADVSGSLAAGSTSYDNSIGTTSTTKYYRVKAVRSGIDSGWSSVVNGKTASPAPSSCAVAPVSGAYTLRVTWTDNSGDESGFTIERSNNGSTGWAEVGTVGAGVVTFDDTTVGAGDTTRYYRVATTRADGVNSAYSNTDSDVTAPQAPSSLAATVSNLLATLTWTDNSPSETSFLLERKYESGAYATIATPAANAVTYPDTTQLLVNHTYTYRLTAVRSGDSMSSPPTTLAVQVPPEEVTSLRAACTVVNSTSSKVRLSWSINSDKEDGFVVQRSTDGNSYSTITTTNAGVATYEDTGLTADATYYYRVKASGTLTDSNPCTAVSIQIKQGKVSNLLYAFEKKTKNFPFS